MKKAIFAIVLMSWLIMGVRPSHAVNISLTPAVQNVSRGQLFSETLSISGFSPNLIGAFSLDIAFNPALLSFTSASFFLGLGDPALFQAITFTDSSVAGISSLGEVSLLSNSELAGLQSGSNLSLATLNFTSRNTIGSTTLQLQNVVVGDANGNPLSVVIGAPSRLNIIPEPSAGVLFILGFVSLGLWRRICTFCGKPALRSTNGC
jgi:hypothetical protein